MGAVSDGFPSRGHDEEHTFINLEVNNFGFRPNACKQDLLALGSRKGWLRYVCYRS